VVSLTVLLLKFYGLFKTFIMGLLVLASRAVLVDVIVRTDECLLRECLNSICAEIPVGRIIVIDADIQFVLAIFATSVNILSYKEIAYRIQCSVHTL
jgi:hypothetical protein